MKKYLIILSSVLLLAGCGKATVAAPKVDWAGHPVVSDNDPVQPRTGWIGTHQIGFREDGVVVWRIAERKVAPVQMMQAPTPPAAPAAPQTVVPYKPAAK